MKARILRFLALAALDSRFSSRAGNLDRQLAQVHRRLTGAEPVVCRPTNLHDCIMDGVRLAARADQHEQPSDLEQPSRKSLARFALPALGASAVVCAVLLIAHVQSGSQRKRAPSVDLTLATSDGISDEIQPLAPLETELQLLSRDIDLAIDHLRRTSPL